jgi:hypothetical protein
VNLSDIKRAARALMADTDQEYPIFPHVWRLDDLLEAAYYAGRESAVREMQAHMAEVTEQRLAVEQAVRLSKQGKREVA